MIDPHAYTITVRRRDVEGDLLFEANVAELPDLSGYGDTYQEAYEFVIDLIEELAADAEQEGEPFPQPRADVQGDFSGRMTLRLTRKVHRLAAEAAQREGVSLNAYLSVAIAQYVAEEDVRHDFYSAAKEVMSNIAAQSVPGGTASLMSYSGYRELTAAAGAPGLFVFTGDYQSAVPVMAITKGKGGSEPWMAESGDPNTLQFFVEN